jgi:hypothetical protein
MQAEKETRTSSTEDDDPVVVALLGHLVAALLSHSLQQLHM